MSDAILAIGLLIGGAVIAAVVFMVLVLPRIRSEHQVELEKKVSAARKDTANQSRSTLKGQISEQLAPLLPGFKYRAEDARFIGKPIDLVVFSGYSAVQSKEADELAEVVFIEVKTGTSTLSREEIRVRRCIQEGRVRWEELRLPDRPTALAEGSPPADGVVT